MPENQATPTTDASQPSTKISEELAALIASATEELLKGRHAKCNKICDAALETHESADLVSIKAIAITNLGQWEEGLKLIKPITEKPGKIQTDWLLRRIKIHEHGGQFDEALRFIEHLLAELGPSSLLLIQKAHALCQIGRYHEAKNVLEYANIFTAPPAEYALTHSMVHRHLKESGKAKKLLEDALELENLNLPQKRSLYFEYSAVMDSLGDYETALEAALEGNKLSLESYEKPFIYNAHKQAVDELLSTWRHNTLDKLPNSDRDGSKKIFIVGFPRSGSTMLEHIFDAHSQAYGIGEVSWMKDAACDSPMKTELLANLHLPMKADALDKKACNQIADHYLGRCKEALPNENMYSVDKNLVNYKMAGLITKTLPGAKIIWIQRHPLDCILSSYFQNFTHNHEYAELNSLADFYFDMFRTMKHWQKLLGDSILSVQYENIVANQEKETRRVLEFCGLPWEEECLEFHKSSRVARTASRHQVNQKIYSSSSQRWRRYEEFLDIAISRLRDYGVLDDDLEPIFD